MPLQTACRMASIVNVSVSCDETCKQLLERRPVARADGGLLGALERQSGVLGHRHQHVQLVVARPHPRDRLVHRQDSRADGRRSGAAAPAAHPRGAMPRRPRWPSPRARTSWARARSSRTCRGAPDSAAMQEPVVEHGAPDVPSAGVTQQRLAGQLRAVNGGRAEVVLLGPVEVNGDGAEAERLGGGSCDRRQEVIELIVASDEPGHLQQASQTREC